MVSLCQRGLPTTPLREMATDTEDDDDDDDDEDVSDDDHGQEVSSRDAQQVS